MPHRTSRCCHIGSPSQSPPACPVSDVDRVSGSEGRPGQRASEGAEEGDLDIMLVSRMSSPDSGKDIHQAKDVSLAGQERSRDTDVEQAPSIG